MEYSTYLIKELDDEIHKHLPHYSDLTEVLRNIGVWQFTYEEFETVFNALLASEKSAGAKVALQELYDFSIIGFYRVGGRGYGGSEYIFKYNSPPCAWTLRLRAFGFTLA